MRGGATPARCVTGRTVRFIRLFDGRLARGVILASIPRKRTCRTSAKFAETNASAHPKRLASAAREKPTKPSSRSLFYDVVELGIGHTPKPAARELDINALAASQLPRHRLSTLPRNPGGIPIS